MNDKITTIRKRIINYIRRMNVNNYRQAFNSDGQIESVFDGEKKIQI